MVIWITSDQEYSCHGDVSCNHGDNQSKYSSNLTNLSLTFFLSSSSGQLSSDEDTPSTTTVSSLLIILLFAISCLPALHGATSVTQATAQALHCGIPECTCTKQPQMKVNCSGVREVTKVGGVNGSVTLTSGSEGAERDWTFPTYTNVVWVPNTVLSVNMCMIVSCYYVLYLSVVFTVDLDILY